MKSLDKFMDALKENLGENLKSVIAFGSQANVEDAKNNLIGKCAFMEETNMQQACGYAKYDILGLGFEYSDTLKEKVKQVTSEQILKCAQKYFNDTYVISIIKP